jgi:YidC/Oxa1 family membrane protein insertase
MSTMHLQCSVAACRLRYSSPAVTADVKSSTAALWAISPVHHVKPSVNLRKLVQNIDHVLVGAGVPYSYGFAIIALTVLVKIATFPLTQKQVQSTVGIQALQPSIKKLQAQYANDPQRLQMETARLYKEAQVNPLAGCLPTLATIPVFIGLYRALTLAASDGLLTEGFFFVPSLGGPTASAGQAGSIGTAWLFPFVNGAPPLGWEDTAKYLVLPVLLIASQYASLQISQPKGASDDPQVQSTQKILKFLPLMIGARRSHTFVLN